MKDLLYRLIRKVTINTASARSADMLSVGNFLHDDATFPHIDQTRDQAI